ncbi:hypothetical protein BGX28_000276 [Mortierella sp. GBA30]|nr:hypothetical protein BGX28_000276 [Mortierella sp. GBA30]
MAGIRSLDVLDMIDKQECLKMKTCMTRYLAWHPHLPTLDSLYDAHCHQPNNATSILLASMYLVAGRHLHPMSSSLMQGLSAAVDRLGTQLILTSTRDIRIVQAFELLLAHDPSLVGTLVGGDQESQKTRGNGLAGESLLMVALYISKDLELDKSVHALHNLLNRPKETTPDGHISQLLVAASLWINLRIWEGHYVLLKPKFRVIHRLDDLARLAECMIGIDELGNKIEALPLNVTRLNLGSVINGQVEDEEKLRSAGRTALAYRMQFMAGFHEAMDKIEKILTPARDEELGTVQPEGCGQTAEVRATDGQTKDKIVETITTSLSERSHIEQRKQADMSPHALSPTIILLEEWCQLEMHTLFSMLCTFGVGSLYTGQFDTGFAAKAFMESIKQDQSLRDRISIVGKHRLELSELVVSSFAHFNRRLTIRGTSTTARSQLGSVVELTGAPIFLTCALVVDACKLLLEGAAFVLIAYFVIHEGTDSRLLLMAQAAQRLEEFDGNQYTLNGSHKQNKETDVPPPPLSICQVSAKYIREMIETMQRWRLAASLYRRPGLLCPGDMRPKTPAPPLVQAHYRPVEKAHNGVARDGTAQEPPVHNRDFGQGQDHPHPSARPSMDYSAQRSGHSHTIGPQGSHDANVSGCAYVHPLSAGAVSAGQAHFAYNHPMQFWPPETDPTRGYGSVEYLVAGTFPDPTHAVSDVGGMYDLPLFDSVFETLFQH